MFERYTELARRTIFFARYEASQFDAPYIETEHLLLGLMREGLRDMPVADRIAIRREVEKRAARGTEHVSTSVDLPLSREARRVLEYAEEESRGLQHDFVDVEHLVLGILRLQNCLAAELLREHGFSYAAYREAQRLKAPPKAQAPLPRLRISVTPPLQAQVEALTDLIESTLKHIETGSEYFAVQKLKRKPWSRVQALGHLIDWANAHQQWFARALVEPKLVTNGYPQDDWVEAQGYADWEWSDLVSVWWRANLLIVHVIARIPEDKLNTPCRIGIAEPIPLAQLVGNYVDYCEDLICQILAKL